MVSDLRHFVFVCIYIYYTHTGEFSTGVECSYGIRFTPFFMNIYIYICIYTGEFSTGVECSYGIRFTPFWSWRDGRFLHRLCCY